MRNNVALAVLVALSGTIGACSDRQPLMSRAPARLLDLAPLPPTAETVFADSIDPATGGLPLYYVWTDFARLTFWNFSIPYDFFADGSRRQILVPNSWAPPEWQRVQIDGGKHASAVRVTAYTMTGFAMTCHTKSGGAVSSRIDGPGNFVLAKGVLDVQAPGIAYCTFFGSGGIESLSYVPERQQEPKLGLKCDGRAGADSVIRGNRMECIVSSEPAGAALANVRWQFEDEQGHAIAGPSGGDLNWGGVMVVGGKMQVTATLSDKPVAAVVAVTVTPRDWTGKITFPPEPQPTWVRGDPLKYPPTMTGDTLADGTLGKARYPHPEPASGYGEGTGPNAGWYFLDQLPYFSPSSSQIFLNVALQPSDPFYQAQRGQQGQLVFGTRACGQDFMRAAARHVPAHESGHYTRAKGFAEGAGAPLLESAAVFGTDPAADSTAYKTMFRTYLAEDSAIQDDWDKRNVLRVPCTLTVPTN